MTQDLAGLLERVEACEGPDRDLEREIALACGYVSIQGPPFEILSWPSDDIVNPAAWPRVKAGCTSSVDAALGLVERVLPDWAASLHWGRYGEHDEREPGVSCALRSKPGRWGTWIEEAYAPTAPLAILAALLRAVQAQQTKGE